MPYITPQAEEYRDWKFNPITQWVLLTLTEYRESLREEICEKTGENPIRDSWKSGYHQCLTDLINLRYENLLKGFL